MADRLTQLQDAVDFQAETLEKSIGFCYPVSTPKVSKKLRKLTRKLAKQSRKGSRFQNDSKSPEGCSEAQKTSEESQKESPTSKDSCKERSLTPTPQGSRKERSPSTEGSPKKSRKQSRSSKTRKPLEDYSLVFATTLTKCAKDIDSLIESLPGEDLSAELQVASLQRLEQENHDAALKLKDCIAGGEALLKQVQNALADINQFQIHAFQNCKK